MSIYVWSWKLDDGSDRHIEITTMMGIDVARQRACALFPEDTIAQEYITEHEPVVK